MSSKTYEESGYIFDLDPLTILYKSNVLYLTRVGSVETSNHLRLIYLRLEQDWFFIYHCLTNHLLATLNRFTNLSWSGAI